jgi:hypothetical protein
MTELVAENPFTFLVVIPAFFVLANGWLLRLGRRRVANQPGAGYAESTAVALVSAALALVASTMLLVVLLLVMPDGVWIKWLAGALSLLYGLFLFVLAVEFVCGVSFRAAFRAGLPVLVALTIEAGLMVAVLDVYLLHFMS